MLGLLVMLGVSLFGTGVSVVSFLLPGAVVAAFFVVVFYSLLVAVKFHVKVPT